MCQGPRQRGKWRLSAPGCASPAFCQKESERAGLAQGCSQQPFVGPSLSAKGVPAWPPPAASLWPWPPALLSLLGCIWAFVPLCRPLTLFLAHFPQVSVLPQTGCPPRFLPSQVLSQEVQSEGAEKEG